MPPKKIDVSTRFWAKASATGNQCECWEWTAARDSDGYGRFCVSKKYGTRNAHRISYSLCIGSIPDGLTIDHLCGNRGCVNPWHMEAVTSTENTLRGMTISAGNMAKSQCKHGHAFSAENTWVYKRKDGRSRRECRTCVKARDDRHRASKRADRGEANA